MRKPNGDKPQSHEKFLHSKETKTLDQFIPKISLSFKGSASLLFKEPLSNEVTNFLGISLQCFSIVHIQVCIQYLIILISVIRSIEKCNLSKSIQQTCYRTKREALTLWFPMRTMVRIETRDMKAYQLSKAHFKIIFQKQTFTAFFVHNWKEGSKRASSFLKKSL